MLKKNSEYYQEVIVGGETPELDTPELDRIQEAYSYRMNPYREGELCFNPKELGEIKKCLSGLYGKFGELENFAYFKMSCIGYNNVLCKDSPSRLYRISVYKSVDEWYYVIVDFYGNSKDYVGVGEDKSYFRRSTISISDQIGQIGDRKLYRCDQLDGLLNFLKDILSEQDRCDRYNESKMSSLILAC